MRSVGKTLSPAPLALGAAAAIFLTTAGFGQCPAPSWSAMNTVPGVFNLGTAPSSTRRPGTRTAQARLRPSSWSREVLRAPAGACQRRGDVGRHLVAGPRGPRRAGGVSALGVWNGDLVAGAGPAGVYQWNGSPGALGSLPTRCELVRRLQRQSDRRRQWVSEWNGTAWTTLGTFAGGTHTAHAVAVYNGDLYAAGHSPASMEYAATGIARWNGTSWQAVGTGLAGGTPVGPQASRSRSTTAS